MTMHVRKVSIAATALSLACLSPLAMAASEAESQSEGWDWVVAPYIWAAGVSTDLNTKEPPTATDTEFKNIVDKIDGAFLLHVEGQGDDFGVFADVVYLGLQDHHDHPRFRTQTDLDSTLFEAAAVWNPADGRFTGLDVFAGLRYIDVDLKVQIDPANPIFDTAVFHENESYSDFMVGVRYNWKLSERWGMTLRGDGSFGETDGTWNVSGTVQYHMKRGEWIFGYRYLEVALKPRENTTELILSGVMVGYGFNF